MDNSLRDMLVKVYHLESLSQDKQDEMIGQIGSLVFQGVMIRVLPMMSESQQKAFEKLATDNASPEVVMSFLAKEIPNFEQIVTEEAQNFYNQSQSVMGNL